MTSGHQEPIRVLLCASADLVEGPVRKALESVPEAELVGVEPDGVAAVSRVRRTEIDIVILDIGVGEREAMTIISRLRRADASIRVVMTGSVSFANVRTSMRGLMEGAADFVATPTKISAHSDEKAFKNDLVRVLRALGRRAHDKTPAAATEATARKVRQPTPGTKKPKVLLIGSSTGGPQAMAAFMKQLGTDFPLPILVTQHMPPGFTSLFAQSLGRASGLTASEAGDGDEVKSGHILVAPGGRHMLLEKKSGSVRIKLDDGPPVNFCKPAVDPFFASAAEVYDGHIVAVVLTGMGADGREGSRPIVAKGGTVIAQDEATSVVWGMPGAVAGDGLAAYVLPLDDIAAKVRSLL